MVSVKQTDELLEAIERFGKKGKLPQNADPKLVLRELAKEIDTLRNAVSICLRHQRQGPDWEAPIFLRADDAHAITGLLTVTHDLGYTPDNFVIIRVSSNNGNIALMPNTWGYVRIYQADEREATFQFDKQSRPVSNGTDFKVILFRSEFVGRDA